MVRNRSGFGLSEIVIAIAILGILGAVVMPAFFKRTPIQERKVFVAALSTLLSEAWSNALINRRIQKIIFEPDRYVVRMEQFVHEATKSKASQEKTEAVKSQTFGDEYHYPEQIKIEAFFVEGVDEMKQQDADSTTNTNAVWFFVIPDGNAQEVVIQYRDTRDTYGFPEGKIGSLKLNPFVGVFNEIDSFVTATP